MTVLNFFTVLLYFVLINGSSSVDWNKQLLNFRNQDLILMLLFFQSSKSSLVEKQLQFAYDTHRYEIILVQ